MREERELLLVGAALCVGLWLTFLPFTPAVITVTLHLPGWLYAGGKFAGLFAAFTFLAHYIPRLSDWLEDRLLAWLNGASE